MKNTAFIAFMLLAISIARAEWEFLANTEDMRLIQTDGSRIFASFERGLYTSHDQGNTWCTTALRPGGVEAIAISGNVVYASVYKQGIFRSDDYGETWTPKNNGLHILDNRTGEVRFPSIHQILVTRSGTVIAVGFHNGTFTSTDRGETWHGVIDDWILPGDKKWQTSDIHIARDIWSMTEFNGYLWAYSPFQAFRSPDNGETWEALPYWEHGSIAEHGWVADWTVLNDQLYVAGDEGFGRWNEADLAWDDLNNGLPDNPELSSLAVNRGRIFAAVMASSMIGPGVYSTVPHGVYVFDEQSETWSPAGLQEFGVNSLVSHQSHLYAAAYARGELSGIYRASIPIVHSYGKAPTTWGAIKTK